MDELSLPRLDLRPGDYQVRIIKHLQFGLNGGPVALIGEMTDGREHWQATLIPSDAAALFDVTIDEDRTARIGRDYLICQQPPDDEYDVDEMLEELKQEREFPKDEDTPPFDIKRGDE
jgi:hypothetical protein